MSYTEREAKIRESIEIRKPEVWRKIQNIPNQIKAGKSIALLQMIYSTKCQLRCRHCGVQGFIDHPKERSLTPIDVKNLADQAHVYGLFAFCISGGEPLSFPDLEKVIDYISPEKFILSMDTNGILLSEEKIQWLVGKGVDRIHLSIDGMRENHSKFRKTNINSWQHNIDMLPLCKKYGLGTVVNVVSTKSLVESGELEKQLEFLQKTGNHISMIFPKPVGSFEDAKDQVLNTKDIEYLESLTKKYNCSTHLTPAYGRDMGCIAAKRHFSCTNFGDILSCPWIPVTFGSILEEGLDTILTRMLKIKWFSWDTPKHTCMSGNVDSYFYQNVLPQLENFPDEYPVDYRKINFHEEYFDEK